jgi:hypothetical protein
MADLTTEIETAAQEPATATSDGQTAASHPLPDLIAANKYLKSQEAATGTNIRGGPKSAWGMLRAARRVPPGGGPC